MSQQYADIASAYRDVYRAKFRDDVLAGTKKPFLVPLQLLGYWVLPTLYLAIPHKNRPWLYRARWLVLACAVAFNVDMILNVSSHNFAAAYGAGLIGAWGIVWNLTLLVWTRPQWDAKRVEIRRKRKQRSTGSDQDKESCSSAALSSGSGHNAKTAGNANYLHRNTNPQQNGNGINGNTRGKLDSAKSTGLESNGHTTDANGLSHTYKGKQADLVTTKAPSELVEISDEERKLLLDAVPSLRQCQNDDQLAVELDKLAAEQEFEYYWQEYPSDASFWTRLDWAFDIVSTFRMTGWNWAISCLPPYKPPLTIRGYQLPLSSVRPHRSKEGYTRHTSLRSLLLSRLFLTIIPCYLAVDFCAVHMTADPYFVLGPEHGLALPAHLAPLPPALLSARRASLSLLGTLSALHLVFGAGSLALALLPPLPQTLRLRAHPWHLPGAAGSLACVLDRGLPGFWGAWWHQTFRFGFAAPARWLERQGYVKPGSARARAAAVLLAFAQSGFLHASGSYSTVPRHTRALLPPLFFALAGVGCAVQGGLARAPGAKGLIARSPRWARRTGNLVFVLAWMWATSWALVDDFGRCGLWLYEPVPVSVFRALGYGPTLDRRVWRYDRDFWPRWHWGEHWWDSGIAI